jgi:hypothetical protein
MHTRTPMARTQAPHRPNDIVIHSEGPGAYVIVTVHGERLGRSKDRRDAMVRACTVAKDTDASVWLCIDSFLDIYTEVVCP